LAIDAKLIDGKWMVFLAGGKIPANLELFEWAKKGVELGAGEILFTSMDHDGTKSGFAVDALDRLSKIVNVPIIASGGCGAVEHFEEVFKYSGADAALAASVFHFGEIEIPELKAFLKTKNIDVR
jgi:cyclase